MDRAATARATRRAPSNGRRALRRPGAGRRAFALIDAIIGGVILAIGLTAILSLTARAIWMQRMGEIEIVAANLLDEMLATVLAEGPDDFRQMYDSFGRYEPPFEEFDYEIAIEDRGLDLPWRVTAIVRHVPTGREFAVETLIADRRGDEPNPIREPEEPIDRQARHDELEEFDD